MGDELKSFFEKQVPLEERAWKDVQGIIEPREFKRKDHFLHQGEICKQLGFIVKGYVRLYFLKDGDDYQRLQF